MLAFGGSSMAYISKGCAPAYFLWPTLMIGTPFFRSSVMRPEGQLTHASN
jgi:hypothetical protein